MSTEKTGAVKKIAILSNDKTRKDLIEWSYTHKSILSQHEIIAAADTADILAGTLNKPINRVESTPGSFNGQVAEMIREREIDLVIFLGDTGGSSIIETADQRLHDLAVRYGVPVVTGRATADLLMPSLRVIEKAPSAYATVLNMIRQNVILMGGLRRKQTWAV